MRNRRKLDEFKPSLHYRDDMIASVFGLLDLPHRLCRLSVTPPGETTIPYQQLVLLFIHNYTTSDYGALSTCSSTRYGLLTDPRIIGNTSFSSSPSRFERASIPYRSPHNESHCRSRTEKRPTVMKRETGKGEKVSPKNTHCNLDYRPYVENPPAF